MGFVISVLYFVTYYLTPATIFGPLAPFRVEMILAILVIVISIPRLPGSIVLKTPQSLALVGLTLAIFLSVLASLLWFGGALSAMLSFVPCAFAYYLACLHCNSIKRLRVLALMLILVCMFVIANGLIESAQGVQESRSQQPDYSGTPYLLAMGNDAGAVILRLRGLGRDQRSE